MNFEQNKGLAAMREAAWAEFDRLGTQLDRTRENLESRMGGNSTSCTWRPICSSMAMGAAGWISPCWPPLP